MGSGIPGVRHCDGWFVMEKTGYNRFLLLVAGLGGLLYGCLLYTSRLAYNEDLDGA